MSVIQAINRVHDVDNEVRSPGGVSDWQRFSAISDEPLKHIPGPLAHHRNPIIVAKARKVAFRQESLRREDEMYAPAPAGRAPRLPTSRWQTVPSRSTMAARTS